MGSSNVNIEDMSYSVLGLGLSIFLIIYGISSYAQIKSLQYLNNRGDNINLKEFFKNYMISIAGGILAYLFGCPLLYGLGILRPILLDSVEGSHELYANREVVVVRAGSADEPYSATLNLRFSRLIEDKINENDALIKTNRFSFRQRFLNSNIARFADLRNEEVDLTDAVNFAQEQIRYIERMSLGRAVVLTQEHIQANAINGHRLVADPRFPDPSFQEGDLVRRVDRKGVRKGITEYVPVGRRRYDTNFIRD